MAQGYGGRTNGQFIDSHYLLGTFGLVMVFSKRFKGRRVAQRLGCPRPIKVSTTVFTRAPRWKKPRKNASPNRPNDIVFLDDAIVLKRNVYAMSFSRPRYFRLSVSTASRRFRGHAPKGMPRLWRVGFTSAFRNVGPMVSMRAETT